ncbi:lipoprotein [Ectothiorhodospiraceae bacterium 2226]|nr:lipoprotein [Ectothiorhodospiraceae bacterium 2226]
MHALRPLLLAALCLVALSGCGQKGPLYLPDPESPATAR